MTKLIIILSVAIGALTLGVDPVSAASCTTQYEKCLNDSWDTEGVTQLMADVECAAEYAGCVGSKIIFW
jgi:hypothetical protein